MVANEVAVVYTKERKELNHHATSKKKQAKKRPKEDW